MTFDKFMDFVKQNARMQGRAFTSPDDDWPMTVVVEHEGERPHVFRAPIDPNVTEQKDALGWALAQAVKLTKPTKVGVVQSAWYVRALTDEDRDIAPSQHPDRVEAVVVVIADPEIQAAAFAPIERSKRHPPKLGAWEDMKRIDHVSGRLFGPLVQALR